MITVWGPPVSHSPVGRGWNQLGQRILLPLGAAHLHKVHAPATVRLQDVVCWMWAPLPVVTFHLSWRVFLDLVSSSLGASERPEHMALC